MHCGFLTIINEPFLPFSSAGETSLWTGSNHSSATPMSSTTMPPSHFSGGTASSSHSTVTLSSSSPASVELSSSQVRVTLSSSQTVSTVFSSFCSVAPSSSQSHVTLSSTPSQYRHTLSSSERLVTLSPSQLGVTLSSSESYGTLSTALTTLQETIENTDGLGGTTYSTLEAFQILHGSFLFDRTISVTHYRNSAIDSTARKTNIPTLIWDPTSSHFPKQSKSAFHESMSVNSELMQDTVYASGQARHNLVSTSSLTSGNSTSVISPTIFQLHQSAEISHAVHAISGNTSQDTVGLAINTSASLQPLSVIGDIPLSRVKLTSLTISQVSTNEMSNLSNLSHEDALVTGTPISSLTITFLHQETIQKTQYISLHSFANIPNQTSLTGIASHATDSTNSTSTASISNSHHSGPSSSWNSWNYHFHSNSKSSTSKAYSSTSVDHRFIGTIAFQSVPTWNRSTIPTVGFIGKTILISNKFSSLSRTSGNIIKKALKMIY